MPNPHKGDVEFKVDETTYTLRYSIDAICHLEDATGKTLLELAEDLKDFKSIRMSLVRKILHAGLREHHPDLTEVEAGELIVGAGGSVVIMTKFNEAMTSAFPKQEASGTPRPPKRSLGRKTG